LITDIWEVQIADPPKSTKWIKFKGNREQIFEKLTEDGRVCHSNFGDFRDDVVILAEIRYNIGDFSWQQQIDYESHPVQNCYMYFWFDRDCSDCEIGRFRTTDTTKEVEEEFARYVGERQQFAKEGGIAKEIPLHYFRGWLKG
jgi:hypothetical protein